MVKKNNYLLNPHRDALLLSEQKIKLAYQLLLFVMLLFRFSFVSRQGDVTVV